MAKSDEIMSIVDNLIDAYPRNKIKPETVVVYAKMLADLDVNHLRAAALEHITKSQWFPSVHELRQAAVNLQKRANAVPSAAEAWQEMLEAPADGMHRKITDEQDEHGRTIVEVWKHEFSHALVEKVARNLGWPRKFWTDNLVSDRSKFVKFYEAALEQGVDEALSLPAVNQYIAGRLGKPQELRKLLPGGKR